MRERKRGEIKTENEASEIKWDEKETRTKKERERKRKLEKIEKKWSKLVCVDCWLSSTTEKWVRSSLIALDLWLYTEKVKEMKSGDKKRKKTKNRERGGDIKEPNDAER